MSAAAMVTQASATSGAQIERAYGGLVMNVSPAEAKRRLQELQAFVKEAMVEGVDYGVIPGTGGKPSLYKPGAEKLSELYGFSIGYEPIEEVKDWEAPFFYFKLRCILTSRRDDVRVGEGLGSCNSREDRYAWRWLDAKKLPKGTDVAKLKQRPGKWGTLYRLPNEDIFSLVNTLEKMAAKRALVMAVIGATRSSGLFTQDVEDLPREAFGEVDAERSWEQGAPATNVVTMPTQHENVQTSAPANGVVPDATARTAAFKEQIEKCGREGTGEELNAIVTAVMAVRLGKENRATLVAAHREACASMAARAKASADADQAFAGFQPGAREPGQEG